MSFSLFVELFAFPLTAVVIAAIAAPLVGVFLRARGTAFHGIVLPELATLGVACAFAAHPYLEAMHGHTGDEPAHGIGTAYPLLFALVTITLGLLLMGRARRGESSAGDGATRAAVVFVIASGLTVFAKERAPHGGLHVDAMLSGETLAIGGGDVAILAGVSILALLVITIRWRRITLAGQDPDFARTIGVDPGEESFALGVVTVLVVMAGTLSLGALPLFALLVLPAWALGHAARSMRGLLIGAPLVGLVGAAAGVGLAFGIDAPVGASVAVGASAVALAVRLIGRLLAR